MLHGTWYELCWKLGHLIPAWERYYDKGYIYIHRKRSMYIYLICIIYIYVKYLEPNPTLVWCVECKPWLDILTHFRGGKILQTKGVLFWVLYVYMRRSWTSQLPPLPKLIPCQQPPPGWLTMFPWKNLGTWYSWWFRNSANQLTGHLICRIPANACNPLIHLFRLIGQWSLKTNSIRVSTRSLQVGFYPL